MICRALLAALAFAWAGATFAASDDALAGVWQGTLGKQAIVACFNDDQSGFYYYEKHGYTLHLDRSSAGVSFEERSWNDPDTAPGGYWKIAVESGELRGEWSAAAKDSRALPIRAQRRAVTGAEACDSDAFNGPRLAVVGTGSRSAVQAKLRVELAKGRLADVERLQMVGKDAATVAINRELDAAFRSYLLDAYDCYTPQGPGDYAVTPSIEFANADWVVARMDAGSYCGGAHPNWGAEFLSFERSRGRKVDTADWFEVPDKSAADFWRLFASKVESRDECSEAWSGENVVVSVRPSPRGVRVDPFLSHAAAACVETAEFSLDEARPYLSAEALKALAPRQ